MSERSNLISWIRGEIVGPGLTIKEPAVIDFIGRSFTDEESRRSGPLYWRPTSDAALEEVLYFQRETPHRKYGAGLLHPAGAISEAPDEAALSAGDTMGAEADAKEEMSKDEADVEQEDDADVEEEGSDSSAASQDDFEVTSPDARHPSSLAISFCARLGENGRVVVRLPLKRKFSWQSAEAPEVPLNGRYELCSRRTTDDMNITREAPIWRRVPAVPPGCEVLFERADLLSGSVVRRDVTMPSGSPISLRIEAFPRRLRGQDDCFLITVVLRNSTPIESSGEAREQVLYQTHFDVEVLNGELVKYPESERPLSSLDAEEQSLALLYRDSATWAIGHGCAAGWESDLGATPKSIFSDVMPSVQLPSMTPDIEVDGEQVKLSMRSLSELPEDGTGDGWRSLEKIISGYADWIDAKRQEAIYLDSTLAETAARHLEACKRCLDRIKNGVELLRGDTRALRAFRLANLAMLLQQIGTKQLDRRSLIWDATNLRVKPSGDFLSPAEIYERDLENRDRVGSWRAFQIAFLLMSLQGVRDGQSPDRNIVDLIWFPTGGGKTEAYLGVMAFYLFHERLLMEGHSSGPRRDGTNVIMRYTLRMLTTQQFQRAASLICSMEYLRRNPSKHLNGNIPGQRFSLGLWIGSGGSPNKVKDAKIVLRRFRNGDIEGNPLVLTECPWCRAEIGRFNGSKPRGFSDSQWAAARTCGIQERSADPLLLCSDARCEFGQESSETWLPVEVIDERIYQNPPSIIISTADKFAIIAYRPEASSLFGSRIINSEPRRVSMPPGLIIQDELHLISGPLGTMYALYEGVIEKLCSAELNGATLKPKLIASTATIRGAADQVRALYARTATCLFPAPGLSMGDSFFGKYARDKHGKLRPGRLYLGIHANDYGSVLTTQVRTFSSALFLPWSFAADRRDAWWTLLAFYNSIRELGGARTLFDSDIRSRLKFIFNREGFAPDDRRQLRIIEELTSRLSQAEIVGMMDRLSTQYDDQSSRGNLDACLASNIIEVGVDIDRLSLMGVVGQPKSTASYIQVTGRVGRRWWDRAGLILMIYNPSKSRDRSHYEQFHSYHRRLYERVEPNTTTPFATSAIQRALPGALIAWARQQSSAPVFNYTAYAAAVDSAYQLLCDRCVVIQPPEDQSQSLASLKQVRDELISKWQLNPQEWEKFPQRVDGEYLMLWPGQFATKQQERRGVVVPSSMRQVERSAELTITQGYDTAS